MVIATEYTVSQIARLSKEASLMEDTGKYGDFQRAEHRWIFGAVILVHRLLQSCLIQQLR